MTYSYSGKSSPGEGLAAREHTPWIGVHALTEFMFCPRAGLIAYEIGQDDDDEFYEEQRTNLQYLPCYDQAEIETRLNWTAARLKICLQKREDFVREQAEKKQLYKKAITERVLFVAVAIYCFGFGSFWSFFILVAIYIYLICHIPHSEFSNGEISSLESDLRILKARREAALAARPKAPSESTDNELVNWWDLLAAGFESVSYQEPLRDRKWRVAGRPWRILKKGSLRIPVWRRKDENASNVKRKIERTALCSYGCILPPP